MAGRYIHLNAQDAPVKQPGESDRDYQARLEHYRKHDHRIPVAGLGKVNFGYYRVYDGSGVVNRPALRGECGGDFSQL